MLAILKQHRELQAESQLVALDTEIFTTRAQIQTWPHYTRHAAGIKGMRPIPVLEFGWATCSDKQAVQVQNTLAKAEQAKSGKNSDGSQSKQFRNDTKSKAVNRAAYDSVNRLGRQQARKSSRIEPRKAWALCKNQMEIVGAAANIPILTHNSSGFDERACLRIELMSKAGLHTVDKRLHVDPQKAVWLAAEELLKSPTLRAFYQGYRPLLLLLNVLWDMLQDSDKHKDLMGWVKKAEIKRLPCSLEWVFQVFT